MECARGTGRYGPPSRRAGIRHDGPGAEAAGQTGRRRCRGSPGRRRRSDDPARGAPSHRGLPLLRRPAGGESRAALLQVATLRFWPAKATILSEGAYPDRVCVVVSGLVQLCTVFEEREVSLLLLTPGSAFAVSAVLRQEPLIASARAVLPSVVVDIPAQEIHARLAGADSFATLLLHDLASSYRVLLQAIGQRPKRLGGGTGGCGHARHPPLLAAPRRHAPIHISLTS